jgi:PadR family transcriptional regulator
MFNQELKKGSAELLILALLEDCPRHGYDVARHIESRSRGALTFHAASLYPILYRLEKRRLIAGRWVEKPGQRRRRYYSLTREGRVVLAEQRSAWETFVVALGRVAGVKST